MTAHPIPADTDLIDLIAINRRYEIEDALAARKARRTRNSARSRKGAATVRARIVAANPFEREGM